MSLERLEQLIRQAGGGNELAEIAQVDPGTVSKWKGGQIPNGGQLYRICIHFGHSLAWLFGGTVEDIAQHLGRALQQEVINRKERPTPTELIPHRTKSVRQSYRDRSSASVGAEELETERPTAAPAAPTKQPRRHGRKTPKLAG